MWIDPTHVEVTWAFTGSGQIAHITAIYEVTSPGNYVLSIGIQCGTKSLTIFYDNVYIDQYVGVSEPDKLIDKSLLIYPNPTTDVVNIRFKPEAKTARVEIFNAMGQRVLQDQIMVTTGQLSLKVNKLPSGIYFIRVETGKTIYSGCFSK